MELSLVAAAGAIAASPDSAIAFFATIKFASSVFGLIGSVLSMGVGIFLFSIAQFRLREMPTWLALVGMVGTIAIGWFGRPGTFFFPGAIIPALVLFGGSILGAIWLFAMSVILFRWKGYESA